MRNKHTDCEIVGEAAFTTLACLMFGVPALLALIVCPLSLMILIPVGIMMSLVCSAD